MPADEAERFVRACVQPAVEKMLDSLKGKESPYEPAITCLSLVLRHTWGEPSEPDDSGIPQSNAFKSDPLRAYPVADFYLRATDPGPAGPGLELPPALVADEGPHLSYALQWFSFAVISLLGAWIFLRKEHVR